MSLFGIVKTQYKHHPLTQSLTMASKDTVGKVFFSLVYTIKKDLRKNIKMQSFSLFCSVATLSKICYVL